MHLQTCHAENLNFILFFYTLFISLDFLLKMENYAAISYILDGSHESETQFVDDNYLRNSLANRILYPTRYVPQPQEQYITLLRGSFYPMLWGLGAPSTLPRGLRSKCLRAPCTLLRGSFAILGAPFTLLRGPFTILMGPLYPAQGLLSQC
jgi:hypothetical protein